MDFKEQHDKHEEHDHGHKHDAHDKHDQHDHGHGHGHEGESQKKKKKTHNLSLVSSVGFTIQGLLDVPKFNGFMSQLLQAKAADLYRTKGVLAFADQGDAKFVFQGSICNPVSTCLDHCLRISVCLYVRTCAQVFTSKSTSARVRSHGSPTKFGKARWFSLERTSTTSS